MRKQRKIEINEQNKRVLTDTVGSWQKFDKTFNTFAVYRCHTLISFNNGTFNVPRYAECWTYYLVPNGWKMTTSTTRNWLWKCYFEKCKRWRGKKSTKMSSENQNGDISKNGLFSFFIIIIIYYAVVLKFSVWRNRTKKKTALSTLIFRSILMGTRDKQSFRFIQQKFSQAIRREWSVTESSDWFCWMGIRNYFIIIFGAPMHHYLTIENGHIRKRIEKEMEINLNSMGAFSDGKTVKIRNVWLTTQWYNWNQLKFRFCFHGPRSRFAIQNQFTPQIYVQIYFNQFYQWEKCI